MASYNSSPLYLTLLKESCLVGHGLQTVPGVCCWSLLMMAEVPPHPHESVSALSGNNYQEMEAHLYLYSFLPL